MDNKWFWKKVTLINCLFSWAFSALHRLQCWIGSKSGLLVVPESGAESSEVCDWSKEWIVLLIQRLDCLIGLQSGVFDWSKEWFVHRVRVSRERSDCLEQRVECWLGPNGRVLNRSTEICPESEVFEGSSEWSVWLVPRNECLIRFQRAHFFLFVQTVECFHLTRHCVCFVWKAEWLVGSEKRSDWLVLKSRVIGWFWKAEWLVGSEKQSDWLGSESWVFVPLACREEFLIAQSVHWCLVVVWQAEYLVSVEGRRRGGGGHFGLENTLFPPGSDKSGICSALHTHSLSFSWHTNQTVKKNWDEVKEALAGATVRNSAHNFTHCKIFCTHSEMFRHVCIHAPNVP